MVNGGFESLFALFVPLCLQFLKLFAVLILFRPFGGMRDMNFVFIGGDRASGWNLDSSSSGR